MIDIKPADVKRPWTQDIATAGDFLVNKPLRLVFCRGNVNYLHVVLNCLQGNNVDGCHSCYCAIDKMVVTAGIGRDFVVERDTLKQATNWISSVLRLDDVETTWWIEWDDWHGSRIWHQVHKVTGVGLDTLMAYCKHALGQDK